MTYIEQFEAEFLKRLETGEDKASIVRWVSEKVRASYANGISAGQKGAQVVRKGKSQEDGLPPQAR
jgi:hypothetical protein